jgi:hypothetical protein
MWWIGGTIASAGKAETLYVYGIPDTVPDAPDFVSRPE